MDCSVLTVANKLILLVLDCNLSILLDCSFCVVINLPYALIGHILLTFVDSDSEYPA